MWSVMCANRYPATVYRITNCRCQRVTKTFRIYHYRSMKQIHLTCANEIDSVLSSSVPPTLSIHLIHTNTRFQHQMSRMPVTKKMEGWLLTSEATYLLLVISTEVTNQNVAASTKEIAKKSLESAESSPR